MRLRSPFRRAQSPGPVTVRPALDDHREYVGGLWHEIGRHQFRYLVDQGLRPEHVFLDVACGSLRAGIHIIPYLDAGNYLGIDSEPSLVERGVEVELGRTLADLKRPEFVISSTFDFARFTKKPQFAIAQSLFTHLTEADIRLCLTNLRGFVEPGHVFFANFKHGDSSGNSPVSDSHTAFAYDPDEIMGFGSDAGWTVENLREWGHPRGGWLLRFTVPSGGR